VAPRAGEVEGRVDALQVDRVQGRLARLVVVEGKAAVRDSLDGVHDPRLRPRVTYDGGVDLGGIGSPSASV
jgi:hypothetical protein